MIYEELTWEQGNFAMGEMEDKFNYVYSSDLDARVQIKMYVILQFLIFQLPRARVQMKIKGTDFPLSFQWIPGGEKEQARI